MAARGKRSAGDASGAERVSGSASGGAMRLVLPHQLFVEHLDAPSDTRFVLIEHDLLFRQYRFHAHKLVLHRASMRSFADRLRAAGFAVTVLETSADESSNDRLVEVIGEARPSSVTVFDVVDDWLGRDLTAALRAGGYRLTSDDVLESPNFLTSRGEFREYFEQHSARMQHFYSWQRRRLGVLMDGDAPAGGKWSFDEDNRRKLPKGHHPPAVHLVTDHDDHTRDAIDWVSREFPDAPGDPNLFAWPIDHERAAAHLTAFLAERFAEFGPYEDAISAQYPFIYHGLLTPMLNIGLLDPRDVVDAALEVDDAPLASQEGFIRQVIGWREYMRATYHLYGRRLRTRNELGHVRELPESWWDGSTGLEPVDLVIARVLRTGYAHHIERLMVLGNAMCLLRIDPEAVYEWFMEMFVDAYDWVMVPNVYAMSQFAAGAATTTKPYVSGSNYLRKMSDIPKGEWTDDWDALYWTFVHDHRAVFDGNPRSRRIPSLWDGFDAAKRATLVDRARPWLS